MGKENFAILTESYSNSFGIDETVCGHKNEIDEKYTQIHK